MVNWDDWNWKRNLIREGNGITGVCKDQKKNGRSSTESESLEVFVQEEIRGPMVTVIFVVLRTTTRTNDSEWGPKYYEIQINVRVI